MKSWYLPLIIAWLALFIAPLAGAGDICTESWMGNQYDTIGGSYRDPDPVNYEPWICLSHNAVDTGIAVYRFDPEALSFPGLYKYTVRVYGYDNGGGSRTTKYGLFDFSAGDIDYLGNGLRTTEQWVSGSVTSSLGRFSNSSKEIWVVLLAQPDQHGHIKSVKLEIEYNCYPPGIPGAPEVIPNSIGPCSHQEFYFWWQSVPDASKYRLYEDCVLLYEGTDTTTYPPDLYTRPAGFYSYRVSAGNGYGWSAQGSEFLCEVRLSAGVVEHIYLPSGDQCDSVPFEVSWSSAVDADEYWLYIDNDLHAPYLTRIMTNAPDTSTEVILPPSDVYYFNVFAKVTDGCGEGHSPVDSLTVNPIPTAPVWLSSDHYDICQNSVYYVYWAEVPDATHYRVFENDVLVGTFGSQTNRVSRHHNEGGEWNYVMQAMVGNCWGEVSDTVTYTTRDEPNPAVPAKPFTPNTTICPNSPYFISWSPVAGAVLYKLRENSVTIYEGSNLTIQLTNVPGTYEYFLSASDGECFSGTSERFYLEIPAPVDMPDAMVVPDYQVPIDEQYVVAWSTVAGAGYYELYEDGGLIYNGADTQVTLSHDTQGDYVYEVAACDDCGCSDVVSASPVEVREITDVREIAADELPDRFILSQNYPNPFNPVTNIDFALPRAAHVRIEVFNILGGKVCTLVDEYLSAGYKSVQWDGSTSFGQATSSGVYLFRITAGEFSASCKALLMK